MILTDEEINAVYSRLRGETFEEALRSIDFARAIEKAIMQKIGKPVCYHYTVDCGWLCEDMFGHPDGYYPSDASPLYKLPEVKE